MSKEEDDFAESIRLMKATPLPAADAPKSRRRNREFVMVSTPQIDRMREVSITAFVFLRLLHLKFRARGQPIRLTNAALAPKGIHRNSKYKALRELEFRGPDQNPTVERENAASYHPRVGAKLAPNQGR